MPDQEGKQSGPGMKDTPDQAYKSGRTEDIQEGSLGAATGGADVQKSRLPEGADEAGTTQSGGFAGQEADDSPDAGTVGSTSGEGDASPHAQYDQTKAEESATGASATQVPDEDEEGVKGAFDPAPGSLGNDGPDEVGKRGYGQQPDYDANEPGERQQHPKTPSDMGNR
jgi:hypothetical protein